MISAYVNAFSQNNNRVQNVGRIFKTKEWHVKLLTQNFNHSDKQYYNIDNNNLLFDTDFIKVVSYKTNINIHRIVSHIQFAYKVNKYLCKNAQQYDLIYTTMPTIISAFLILRKCEKFGIPLVADVIDIWPESMYKYSGKLRSLLRFVLSPLKLMANHIYSHANILVTASKKYAEFTSNVRKSNVRHFYLGIDIENVSSLIKKSSIKIFSKEKEEIWIVYGGSLGNEYDFDVIIEALILLKEKQINYKMIFLGGGDIQDNIQKKIDKYGLNAIITGRLPYHDYLNWLSRCDIAINSFRKDSLVAYSYKFNDYLASGCCILNNLKGETAELINKYKIGLNFDYNENTLAKIILKLAMDYELIKNFKANAQQPINKELSKKVIYNNYYEYVVNDTLKNI